MTKCKAWEIGSRRSSPEWWSLPGPGHPRGICQSPSSCCSTSFQQLSLFCILSVGQWDQKRTLCDALRVSFDYFHLLRELRFKRSNQRELAPPVGWASRALLAAAAASCELNVRAKVGGRPVQVEEHSWESPALAPEPRSLDATSRAAFFRRLL